MTDLTDRGLRVEIQKTQAKVTFEWSDGLRDTVERARRLRRRVGSLYLFATQRGQPYTANGFASNWKLTLKRAGVSGLTFHDLRRRAITEAERLGGLDYAQAVGVHKSRQATERYVVRGESVVRSLR